MKDNDIKGFSMYLNLSECPSDSGRSSTLIGAAGRTAHGVRSRDRGERYGYPIDRRHSVMSRRTLSISKQ